MQSTEEFWSRKQFAEGSTNNIEHWLVARQRIGKCKNLSHKNGFLFVYNYYLFTIFVAGTLSSSNFVKFPALILKAEINFVAHTELFRKDYSTII